MATLKNTTIAGTEYLQIPKGNYIQRPQIIPKADVFTSVGTTTWACPAGVTTVEALVVAGGGAGGGHGSGTYYNDPGGGGGAGGVVYRRDFPVTPGQSYTVTVGDGGAAVSGADGENGDNSVFATLTAIGGGGGGVGTLLDTTNGNANNGGSGGGGAHGYTVNSGFGGNGTAGQGNPGGDTFGGNNRAHYGQNVATQTAAGGGGAGEAGHNPVFKVGMWNSGTGGAGLYFPQFEKYGGSPAGWFAGGGGAGGSNRTEDSDTAALGGLGGGGRGGDNNGSSGMSTGVANTGAGGGGAGGQTSSGNNVGAAGGSGIVILKYDEPTETTLDPRRYVRYNTDIDDIEVYTGEKGWQSQDVAKNFGGHNYTTGSETFTSWSNYQASLISGITAPDGISTSVKISPSISGNTYSFVNFNTGGNGLATSTLGCFSVYAKAGDYSKLGLSNRSGFSMAAIIDLTNGEVVDQQGFSGTILSVQTQELENGWYRAWIVMPASNQFNIHPVPDSVTDASALQNNIGTTYSTGSGIYIWGGQWEINTYYPGPYTKTVSAIAPAPHELAGYRTHVYKNVGESSFTPAFSGPVEVMIVAGGGAGGGGDVGGGGGAGGLIYENSFYVESDENYKVVVGAGGTGVANSSSRGNRGEDSRFGPLVAIGGGGGSGWGGGDASQGGSGGGSTANGRAGPPVVGQGRYGSDRGLSSPNYPQGGGGGAGGEGMDPPDHNTCGNGGVGLYFPQFEPFGGSPPGWFAGGGGGAAESNQSPDGTSVGIGGLGGGGNGGRQTNNVTVENGVANTGGGGGGDDPGAGGTGGSGIVIIRYKFRQ